MKKTYKVKIAMTILFIFILNSLLMVSMYSCVNKLCDANIEIKRIEQNDIKEYQGKCTNVKWLQAGIGVHKGYHEYIEIDNNLPLWSNSDKVVARKFNNDSVYLDDLKEKQLKGYYVQYYGGLNRSDRIVELYLEGKLVISKEDTLSDLKHVILSQKIMIALCFIVLSLEISIIYLLSIPRITELLKLKEKEKIRENRKIKGQKRKSLN